jgi:hypothetical protein
LGPAPIFFVACPSFFWGGEGLGGEACLRETEVYLHEVEVRSRAAMICFSFEPIVIETMDFDPSSQSGFSRLALAALVKDLCQSFIILNSVSAMDHPSPIFLWERAYTQFYRAAGVRGWRPVIT